MSYIIFNDKHIDLNKGQTVLSALLDNGFKIPNSCRAGACQSCLMQSVEGSVPETSQQGLKDTLKAQGYFLACSCVPTTPLQIALADTSSLRIKASVVGHDLLAKDVLRLRLKPEQAFDYRAGQYLSINQNNSIARSYSLASVNKLDNYLEFHIRRIDQGKVSSWLHEELQTGRELEIGQATGDCFYVPGAADQKIILAGTGTGLAPLIGIARDAIHQGHSGEIHLLHGAIKKDGLYMHQQLITMTNEYPNFHYHASVLQADEVKLPVRTDAIDKIVTDIAINAADWKAYLCGDESTVNTLKKKLFLAGTSMGNIYTDPFITTMD